MLHIASLDRATRTALLARERSREQARKKLARLKPWFGGADWLKPTRLLDRNEER